MTPDDPESQTTVWLFQDATVFPTPGDPEVGLLRIVVSDAQDTDREMEDVDFAITREAAIEFRDVLNHFITGSKPHS